MCTWNREEGVWAHTDYPSLVLVPTMEHIILRLRDMADGDKDKKSKRKPYTLWVDWLLRLNGPGSLGQFFLRPGVKLEPVFPLKTRFLAAVMGRLSIALQERRRLVAADAEAIFSDCWDEIKAGRDYQVWEGLKVMAPTAQGVTNTDLRLKA